MTIATYFEIVKDRLLTDRIVFEFQILRERQTVMDGHLRARLRLADHSILEFAEYVHRLPNDEIQVVTYSYHWGNQDGQLIRRWDNTPHFPDLPGFPHHIHDGSTGSVNVGSPINLFQVLDYIATSTSA